MNWNKVQLAGRLTRDPELRNTPAGTEVASFTIATNRVWKDKDGTKREEVAFIDCEAWGITASTISKHCAKGHELLVAGRLKQDTWEDKTTKQQRSRLKVVVEEFQFGAKRDAAPAQQ